MTNLILFGATILVILHIAGNVFDANEAGDFSANLVQPGRNAIAGFCSGTPSERGSNCVAVSRSEFFGRGAAVYVVTPMEMVQDGTEYTMRAISQRVDYQMGVTPGYYLIRIDPVLAENFPDGSYLVEASIVEARGIPVHIAAGQSNQGALSWIVAGIDGVRNAVQSIILYVTFDYPMLQGDSAALGFVRILLTFFQNAFIVLVIIYGARLIRGAG